LGRDQACYDFVKWWTKNGEDHDYDFGDTSLPYLDVVNANVFEPVTYLCDAWPNLSHLTVITLLKIKLLLDLKSLPRRESSRRDS